MDLRVGEKDLIERRIQKAGGWDQRARGGEKQGVEKSDGRAAVGKKRPR